MVACGLGGLCHYNCLHTLSCYLTGYECKGNSSSAEWKEVVETLNHTFCNDERNEGKTVRSLIGRFLSDMVKSQSVSRQQAVFQRSSGLLKRLNHIFFKVSTTSVDLDKIASKGNGRKAKDGHNSNANVQADDDAAEAAKEKYERTWENVVKRYTKRNFNAPGMMEMNVYRYIAQCWSQSHEYVPMFVGFHDKATWPPSESYAKWNLAIFKPWHKSIEETKDGFQSYSEALMEFMHDQNFPNLKKAALFRAMRKESVVVMDEAPHRDDCDFTPTDARVNRANDTKKQQQLILLKILKTVTIYLRTLMMLTSPA